MLALCAVAMVKGAPSLGNQVKLKGGDAPLFVASPPAGSALFVQQPCVALKEWIAHCAMDNEFVNEQKGQE